MKNKNIAMLLLFTALLTGWVACEKDDPSDSNATPHVKYVRPTNAAAADSLLTKAAMGSTIALIGDGLEGVCEIWFNDQKAKLNPVYITSTSIIVTVPGSMPEEITNTITLKTLKGKQGVYNDFAVIIPSPSVVSILNEWTADGANATIYGNYFFADANGQLVEVLFPGNLKGEVIEFDEKTINVKVPNGALSGTITVETIYGKGRSQFTFREKEGLFIDAEEPTGVWNTWNRSAFATEGGTSGQYILLQGTTGSWAWPSDAISIVYQRPDQTPIVTEGEPGDYALKFEANSIAWSGARLTMWFTPVSGEVDVDSPDVAQYYWQPFLAGEETYVDYVTNGWRTITIPLSEFNRSKYADEKENGAARSIGNVNDLVNFCAMPFGAAAGNAPFDLRLDNFRIVKIK
jgi:hypothetical protein